MNEDIIRSHAQKISNFICNISNCDEENITSTPYVQREVLHEVISKKLDEAEQETKLQQRVLTDLKELVSLTPFDFNEKDIYESRLKSLNNLYYISKEIDNVTTKGNITQEELTLKVNNLDALLQVSNHGPFRNLLEEKINKLKCKIAPRLQEVASESNIITLINDAHSATEIDEILCEALIEEYVNLGRNGREIVARKLFDLSKLYNTNKELFNDLNSLISKVNEESDRYQESKADNQAQSLNVGEFYRETLDIKEVRGLMPSVTI